MRVTLTKKRVVAALVFAVLALPAASHAATVTINFDDEIGYVVHNYAEFGLHFPNMVDVGMCSAVTHRQCVAPYSGEGVARPIDQNELLRQRFVATFDTPQTYVSMRVRSDIAPQPGDILDLTLIGYDAAGEAVSVNRKLFDASLAWPLIEARQLTRVPLADVEVPPLITKIEMYGGLNGAETNYFAVDDLIFDGPVEPISVDSTSPLAFLDAPAEGESLTESPVTVKYRVSDNLNLGSVTLTISQENVGATEATVKVILCGAQPAEPCTNPFDGTRQIHMPGTARAGQYRMTIWACDQNGNCGWDFILFRWAPVQPVTWKIHPYGIELNQGVQDGIGSLGFPGTQIEGNTGVPLIRGRNLLVRTYLFADDETAPGYIAALDITKVSTAGVTGSYQVYPNTEFVSITPPVYPPTHEAADQEALRMRTDLSRTLNYIVPGTWLEDAVSIELKLVREGLPQTSRVLYDFAKPSGIGINAYLMSINGAPFPSNTVFEDTLVPYLQDAYPVTSVKVLNKRHVSIIDTDPFISRCDVVLSSLWLGYGGDDVEVTGGFPYGYINPVIGAGPGNISEDARGCAFVGEADNSGDRIGGTSVTGPWGDTAAQELGHTMGAIHAGNDHGEADGGDAEPWPYPHGSIGNDFGSWSFGMIARAVAQPTPGTPGTWNVDLVDPCPGATDLGQRRPCYDHSKQVHDFMSYGRNSTRIPEHNESSRWISPLTYRRLYGAIAEARPIIPRGELSASSSSSSVAQSSTSADAGRVDALLAAVSIDENGAAGLNPLFRKQLPGNMLTDSPNGAYSLELISASGQVLSSTPFDVTHATVHDSHVHGAKVAIPFVAGIGSVRVKHGDEVLLTQQASANAPAVELLSPAGGETLAEGEHKVRWTGGDVDGDPVYYLVQYSPDGGTKWQGLGVVGPGQSTEVPLFVDELLPGRRGLIRIVASDGINMTTTVSTCGISIGTNEAPICERRIDVKPQECPNKLNPNEKGNMQVIVPGGSGFDVRQIDTASIKLQGVAPDAVSYQDRTRSIGASGCPVPGPDGFTDLILSFNMDRVGATLAPVSKGETRTLTLEALVRLATSTMQFIGTDTATMVASRK